MRKIFISRLSEIENKRAVRDAGLFQVSCTQWKMLLGRLTGRLPENKTREQLMQMKMSPHRGAFHRFLSDLAPDEARRRLQTFTSFLFVRHPLERLVSAFRDKFRASFQDRPFAVRTALEIAAHWQGRAPWQVAQQGRPQPVTFEQFARWVADAPPLDPDELYPPEANNEHWLPVDQLCHPCAVNYTFVGHFDTMREDAQLLFSMVNITSVSLPKRSSTSDTASATGQLLQSLDSQTLRRVLKHYLRDFLLFGYRPETAAAAGSKTREAIQTAFKELVDEARSAARRQLMAADSPRVS